MEYVTVIFPESRTVLIDGIVAGSTNTTLTLEEGTHTFRLSDPQDYKPKRRNRKVMDTTAVKPMEVVFEKG